MLKDKLVIRCLGAELFAWAVTQARLKAFVTGSWEGTHDGLHELVDFAMRVSA